MKGKMKPVDLTYSDKTADKNKEHRKYNPMHTLTNWASKKDETNGRSDKKKIKN